jgi:tRNA/tmRNA/rRNA uracil-C5-methylase (TrmA/RlmC/RlmD family)
VDCPHCRPGAAPPTGWRLGITFPVELEEDEAGVIEEAIREKFMPERLKEFPPAAERLLGKMRRVLDKFRDKRREDEAFAASLTDEERQIIRDRRGNTAGKGK